MYKIQSDRREVKYRRRSNVYHNKTQIAIKFLSFFAATFFLFLAKRFYDQSWIKMSLQKAAKEERLFGVPAFPLSEREEDKRSKISRLRKGFVFPTHFSKVELHHHIVVFASEKYSKCYILLS